MHGKTWTQPSWTVAFVLLLLLHLLPVWSFSYVPTQDGPAHLGSAAALSASAPVLDAFYEAHWRLATNQAYHALLVALGTMFSLQVAEKVLLSVYILLLPLGVLFALRGLGRGRALLPAFLSFPVLYSYVFHLGFYNFLFGLVLYTFALGFAFRLERSPLYAAALTLTLAVGYFTHVIAAALTLLTLGVMVAVRLLREGRGARRAAFCATLAALPTGLLLAGFLAVTERGAARELPGEATNFLHLSHLVREFFVHPPELAYKVYSPLVTHSWLDVVFTLPWHLLLLTLAARALWRGVKGRARPRADLSGALAVVGFIVLWTPNRLGEVGWLSDRSLPFGYVLLILWLAAASLPLRTWRVAAGVSAVLGTALLLYRLPVYAALNAEIRDYLVGARVVTDGSTVLPLNLVRGESVRGLPYPQLRYDPLLHAVGYLALERRVVNLRNYQAAKGYFPLRYRARVDPVRHLSVGGLSALESPPFALDLRGYRELGGSVDYLLLWGPESALGSADVRRVLAQFSDYEVVREGRMHVYARWDARLGRVP